ncbi:MAG TPA: phosphatase PAP2 family protein [Nitrospirota bacterium]|nr:phosphatase PAP2 family protein [Nitrospirota bacterium]
MLWTDFSNAASYTLESPYSPLSSYPIEKSYGTYQGLSRFEDEIVAVEFAVKKIKVPPPSTYFKEFFPEIVRGTGRIFSKDNLPLVLIGVGLTGLAFAIDHTVQDYFEDRKPIWHPANIGDKIGRGYVPFVFGIATVGAGEWANNKKLADTGFVTLEALLVTGIATEGLKYATYRKRPNGGDNMSFPSGHASNMASWAASVSQMYDWDLRVAVPLYLVTAFVGASRIQANEHRLSDILGGITLGTLVGVSFAKYHKEKDAKKSLQTISLSPVFDKDLRGGVITLRFF